jgi:WD40 repeat protein
VRLWAVPAGTPLRALAGHRRKVADAAFSADGRWLASAASDTTVRVWAIAP